MSGGFNPIARGDAVPTLRTYFAVLWRRKLAIVPLVVMLPLVAWLRAETPEPTYEASATVLLNRQSQGLSGVNDPTLWDPSRTIRTQSELARVPEVAARVVEASGLPDRDAGQFLASSSVSSSDVENDLIVLHVRDGDPEIAVRLANLYAEKYIEFRRELDTKALREAARLVAEQIEQLEREGIGPDTQAYQSLIGRQQQLEAAETLQASNALLIREATGANAVAEQGNRTIFLALGLGLILGLGLAFVFETLDTRVRSLDELRDALGLPLLAAIPAAPRWRRRERRLVMFSDPNSWAAEPYRILRASLGMGMSGESRVLMVTSAREGEGKSTTAANLGVAMARAGQHVILVDLDLYRPGLQRMFNIVGGLGLADVAAGKAELEDVVRAVPLHARKGSSQSVSQRRSALAPNGRARIGQLELLTAGSNLDAPGEFVASQGFDVALERMRHRADVVIIDGPPILLSGDALVLTSKVDGLLVVARLNLIKERELQELSLLLESCPPAKLGLIATGATTTGGSYYYGYRTREAAPAPSSSEAR